MLPCVRRTQPSWNSLILSKSSPSAIAMASSDPGDTPETWLEHRRTRSVHRSTDTVHRKTESVCRPRDRLQWNRKRGGGHNAIAKDKPLPVLLDQSFHHLDFPGVYLQSVTFAKRPAAT